MYIWLNNRQQSESPINNIVAYLYDRGSHKSFFKYQIGTLWVWWLQPSCYRAIDWASVQAIASLQAEKPSPRLTSGVEACPERVQVTPWLGRDPECSTMLPVVHVNTNIWKKKQAKLLPQRKFSLLLQPKSHKKRILQVIFHICPIHLMIDIQMLHIHNSHFSLQCVKL